MSRTSLAVSVLLCSSFLAPAAGAQTRPPTVGFPKRDMSRVFVPASPGKQGWHAAGDPMKLAVAVDARIAGLKNVWYGYLCFSNIPEGRGVDRGVSRIVSPSKYHLQFAAPMNIKKSASRTERVVGKGDAIADGTRLSVRAGAGFSKPVPIASANRLAGLSLVRDFPPRFNELLFAGLGNRQRPLSTYIAAVRRPGSGFTVVSEERRVSGHNYRIFVQRTPAMTKKLGALTLEIVFDAAQKLPVSGHYRDVPLKGAPSELSWGTTWSFDSRGFEPSMFTLPKGI